MDGEIAVAIVVEKRVEGLELLDVELLQPAMLLIDGPLDQPGSNFEMYHCIGDNTDGGRQSKYVKDAHPRGR
eukprot:SAG11_NODE_4403_length_1910_cov_2.100497_1_plen_72_part_00